MADPTTRWRVKPVGGGIFKAEEFNPSTQEIIGGVTFQSDSAKQAAQWVAEHNRRFQGPQQLEQLLKADAHKAVRK